MRKDGETVWEVGVGRVKSISEYRLALHIIKEDGRSIDVV